MLANFSWRRLKRRLRFLLSHAERQRLLWEEMEFHIESMAQDFGASGMSEVDALAAARRKFGNMTQKSEESRGVWLVRWLSDLAQDLLYAFRGMRREAGFTVFAILITGLGIGASSTVFSIVNALLLRPLPVREPGQLVWITNQDAFTSTQPEQYSDLRDLNKSFSDLAGYFGGYGVGDRQLSGAGEPERLTAVPVTGNFFPLLGVQPVIGRSFSRQESEGTYSAPPAVLLSYGFWQRHFAADPNVAGRILSLDNKPATIIGVLPASFDFASLLAPGNPIDIFIPWPVKDKAKPGGNSMRIIGRLRPGTTIQGAQAELSMLGKRLNNEHQERNPVWPVLMPLAERVSGRAAPALFVLASAVGVVMLIVCANVSNLQLVRLGARQKELAVRAALGAGRFRLLRQMFTESVTLACCGAVLGLILAIGGTRALAHLSAFNLPLLASVSIDGKALAFTLLAAVLTGILFGLLPALQTPALNKQEALREGGRGMSAGKRHAWLRNALVVSEIAFASILLVGAGLLLRSFVRVMDVNLGFEPEHTATLRVDPSFRIASFEQQNAFIDNVLQKARSVPGVQSAGLIDILPFAGDRGWQVGAKGQVYPKNHHPEAFMRVVTDGYFAAAGILLQSGRAFTERDRATSEPVAIVNQTLARILWPEQDPIGRIVTQDGGRRVVGVVADVRHSALETLGGSEMYLPMRQTADYPAMQLVVRTVLPVEVLAPGIRTALRPIDPNLPVREFQSLQDLVDKSVSPRRFLMMLLGGFAAFALLLASLGIYAVISYSVSQRVQEIGIRMALGASPSGLQGRILFNTFGLAMFGLALGVAASRVLSNMLGSLLFGVTAGDPATYMGVGALLILVAAVAGYIPAWRASHIDAAVALRSN